MTDFLDKQSMTVSGPVPEDAPVMVAWTAYKETPDYANTKRWAVLPENVDGSLWAAFSTGFAAALTALPAGEEKRDLELAAGLRDVALGVEDDDEREFFNECAAALSASRRAGELPREPSREMVSAGEIAHEWYHESYALGMLCAAIWTAMYDAKVAHPVTGSQGTGLPVGRH